MFGRLLMLVSCALFIGLAQSEAQPSGDSSANWVTAGAVHAVARSGSTVYLGGDFNAFAPRSQQIGGAGVFGMRTGVRECHMPPLNGRVNAIIADGVGGWFIGGEFTRAGIVPRQNLVHLTFTCAIDNDWTGGVDGVVNALALAGEILYVGGAFSQAGQVAGAFMPRANLAAFGLLTGAVTTWNPVADGEVHALAVDVQAAPTGDLTSVFAGGAFSQLGGASRHHFGAVDAAGAATSFSADADAPVLAIEVEIVGAEPAAHRLWVGGAFTQIGGVQRNRLARVSVATGNVDPSFDPNANAAVRALVVTQTPAAGPVVYVGGEFTAIGGGSKRYLAAVDTAGLALPSFNPDPDGPVFAVAVNHPRFTGEIYAGGRFTRLGNATRLNAGSVHPGAGNAMAWNPSLNGDVRALLVTPLAYVAAGGGFDAAGAERRRNLAAVNLDTGQLLPFSPDIDGPVRTIAIRDGEVYVGGEFTRIGSEVRNRLASFAPVTLALTSWNPDADGAVGVLLPVGSHIYVGGDFIHVGSTARSRLAAVDAATGAASLTFAPPDFDARVAALAAHDGILYAGGHFTSVSGVPAKFLTRLDAATGAVDSAWLPNPNGPVHAVCVRSTTLYAGGAFAQIGGAARANLAAVDLVAGAATNWQPNPNGEVHALACTEQQVYAGGAFATIGTGAAQQARPRLAALSPIASGPSGAYATSFRARVLGIVHGVIAHADGLLTGATGDLSAESPEPPVRFGFFAQNFTGAPAAPTNLRVESAFHVLQIRWDAPVRGPRPLNYLLEAGSAPGATDLAHAVVAFDTQFELSDPTTIFTKAYVRVRAATNEGESPPSGELSFGGGCSPLGPPQNLSVALNGVSAVFTWSPGSGSGSTYNLEAGLARGRTDLQIATTASSFSAQAPPGVFYVRVRAVSFACSSLPSSEIQLVAGGVAAPPSAPIEVTATVRAARTVTISWKPPAIGTAVSYRLEAGRGFGTSDVGSLPTAGTSLAFSNVPPGTYYVRIFAIGATGESPMSDEMILVVP